MLLPSRFSKDCLGRSKRVTALFVLPVTHILQWPRKLNQNRRQNAHHSL